MGILNLPGRRQNSQAKPVCHRPQKRSSTGEPSSPVARSFVTKAAGKAQRPTEQAVEKENWCRAKRSSEQRNRSL
jgi:hypothetical protein